MNAVPVAEAPLPGAPTYAEIVGDADIASEPFIDDQTPAGHFGVTVTNLGGVQTYWFNGALGDLTAQVVARTQFDNTRPVGSQFVGHYIKCSYLGGELTRYGRA